MLAKVYVTPKKAILDPQGKAIAQSLHALAYTEVGEVRMGKYLEVQLTGPRTCRNSPISRNAVRATTSEKLVPVSPGPKVT